MEKEISFMSDFLGVLFSPKAFFESRFMNLSSRRIFILGFLGMAVGLLLGSLSTYLITLSVKVDFAQNQLNYEQIIKNLGLTTESFAEMLKVQEAYHLMIAILSPFISYMAPHILGGALFGLLWLLAKPLELQISFARVLECTAIALASMAWHVVPGIGPLIAMIMVMLNLSRAIAVQYQIFGFMKAMGILSAVYLCFFLSSATLQLLAIPFSKMLE